MEKYSKAVKSQTRTPELNNMRIWMEKYICKNKITKDPAKDQGVVGKREDNLGIKVTQLMFDNNNRWAHVCPFMRDSLDYDQCWIEESDLNNTSDIESLLLSQINDFKNAPPAYDPIATNQAATLPILWKTFLTFFPLLLHKSHGGDSSIDNLYDRVKARYIQEGLMLGQFYKGCLVPAAWNTLWQGPLVSPWPAFAIRYMAKHDHVFLDKTPFMPVYNKFFP